MGFKHIKYFVEIYVPVYKPLQGFPVYIDQHAELTEHAVLHAPFDRYVAQFSHTFLYAKPCAMHLERPFYSSKVYFPVSAGKPFHESGIKSDPQFTHLAEECGTKPRLLAGRLLPGPVYHESLDRKLYLRVPEHVRTPVDPGQTLSDARRHRRVERPRDGQAISGQTVPGAYSSADRDRGVTG